MTARVAPQGRRLRRFLRRQDGVALVEFAISFPTILIILFIIIETSRMLFAYQAAIGGVRDAARYFARAIPADICDGDWNAWKIANTAEAEATKMVGRNIGDTRSVFPAAVHLTQPVAVTLNCYALAENVGVVLVSASIRIEFPFGNIFALFGAPLAGVTTTVADTSRVLGS